MFNRRKFIQLSSLTAAGMYVGSSLLSSCIKLPSRRLVILHTNDMHSRIEPFPFDHSKHPNLGGMARRSALIEKIRNEESNVLLLDAGDVFQGTPYFNYFGGEVEFKLMSKMGYDAMTLGNHDFDGGIANLIKQKEHASFEIINANYDFSKTDLKDHIYPYKIFDKNGMRIGLFAVGIELEGLVPKKLFEETKYNNPIPVAKEMVQELQRLNCDIIICLSHLGYKYDSDKVSDHTLADEVSGIDVILGGHTHTYLSAPTVLTNSEGHSTVINQVGWAGTHLGRIDFELDEKAENKLVFAQPLEIKNPL
ncbi:MAG: bifunctional metallophosphatase/5'-nucleotidase [Bacteroidia bacterium]